MVRLNIPESSTITPVDTLTPAVSRKNSLTWDGSVKFSVLSWPAICSSVAAGLISSEGSLSLIHIFLAAFGVQIGGFLLQEGMSPQFSLLSKSVLGYSVDGNGGEWKTALLFVGILLILTGISLCFIGRVDFQLKTEEE